MSSAPVFILNEVPQCLFISDQACKLKCAEAESRQDRAALMLAELLVLRLGICQLNLDRVKVRLCATRLQKHPHCRVVANPHRKLQGCVTKRIYFLPEELETGESCLITEGELDNLIQCPIEKCFVNRVVARIPRNLDETVLEQDHPLAKLMGNLF